MNSGNSSQSGVKILDADGVSLVEDDFGRFVDEGGTSHSIKRFTWTNKNRIQVQVINYGASVVSIKMPDRKGEIEDVLLGFDDLAGYLYYDKLYFGSIIGRMSNTVKNSSIILKNKKYTLSSNMGPHSFNGGCKGFDKKVFNTYIKEKKVIMSYVSPHLSEGYPGDLLVRASFELSAKNEFKVSFEAETTQPTCVDISHLLYLNLAGHHKGSSDIYRHILTLNCNCFTPQVNGIPTGEIFNVLYSDVDFQVPKTLGKVMGVTPKDGFDQNLCVNRGVLQAECFVGRLFHPPSGRMLEVYSNQPGVRLSTANEFGYGIISKLADSCHSVQQPTEPTETMLLIEKVHDKVKDLLKDDESFMEIKQLISKMSELKSVEGPSIKLSFKQNEYLTKAREIVCENEETDDACLDLKEILSSILKRVELIETNREQTTASSVTESMQWAKPEPVKPVQKPVPSYYRISDQIRGKERAVYKTHGAISLQTQNYPNAVNIKQFPNCLLNPGEVYKHDIVYRFWIRAGNPSKWIRRNLKDSKPC